ncbi:DNA primase [Mucilaginibacter sp. UR6-1]|uniref:DNA primase n=1 Tax=Mucilaginibacter sp. UR6-1 TaxID=1435643 RepID=UPI001E4231AC|nr:DNA primase [Mucilaginibacter sp. UR6-1]MCC8411126.1 DNA primase [Mucilaginibacter sp. UR6-1]
MITKATVDRIMEATDIVEVIGDFVQLKKRGANYIGLSPFSNERTPSFTVSPAKGIFKDFSSSKGGSAITFLMEMEKFTYPEALKWLAKKYGIEVEETVESAENREEENHRESLMIVSGFAAKFFQDSMWQTDEGQSIGLSYFKERGFTPETIRKFELGYSPDQWEAFTSQAIKEGYQPQFLEETGLSVKRDNGSMYDRYRGRVMFPIHSFTGRVIAFGGRTLKSDKSVPKYVNSPESEIYHKSSVLYGLYFAKKAIRDADDCYLVEGYADVVSVHQAGIENVVASSGTSLTVEQIRLIGRLTKNVTILYDGDAAGIKASLRGLDMILEEGLNVKVVLFPDGHDPDSYVRSVGTNAFKTYIDQNKKDFILYKTGILLKEAGNDPIRKAGVIREIVESIAKIPDSIKASVFVKECSHIMQIDERALLSELNKMRLAKSKKDSQQQYNQNQRAQQHPDAPPEDLFFDEPGTAAAPSTEKREEAYNQEREIIRLLLLYGNRMIDWDGIANTYIGPFIIAELSDVTFESTSCKDFVEDYRREVENGVLPDEQHYIHHKDKDIVDLTVTMLATRYTLSENWYEMHKITVPDEQVNMKATILGAIFHLKKHKVAQILENLRKELQNTPSEQDQEILLNQYMRMKKVEKHISDYLGSVILK